MKFIFVLILITLLSLYVAEDPDHEEEELSELDDTLMYRKKKLEDKVIFVNNKVTNLENKLNVLDNSEKDDKKHNTGKYNLKDNKDHKHHDKHNINKDNVILPKPDKKEEKIHTQAKHNDHISNKKLKEEKKQNNNNNKHAEEIKHQPNSSKQVNSLKPNIPISVLEKQNKQNYNKINQPVVNNIPPPVPQKQNKSMNILAIKDIVKKQKRDIIESMEFNLPEISIDKNQRIEHYYPYFYKTHLLEYNNMIDRQPQSNNAIHINGPHPNINPNLNIRNSPITVPTPIIECADIACEICDIQTKMKCLKCFHGFYSLDNKCYKSCPVNYIADIFKRQCVLVASNNQNTFSRITYLKAFSTGSCINMCGRVSEDCSCQQDCKQLGNCCSDYYICEDLYKKNLNKGEECQSKNPTCELCSDMNNGANTKCSQCKAGYYLRNEECVSICDQYDKVFTNSMTCVKGQRCLVENCNECEDNNPSVCKRCSNGFFLYNNQCMISCPMQFNADRMNWMCLEPSVFAWYWIFPSASSCRNKCDIPSGGNMDCSCRDDCFRYGNCCQDIEEYCYKLVITK